MNDVFISLLLRKCFSTTRADERQFYVLNVLDELLSSDIDAAASAAASASRRLRRSSLRLR